MHIDTLVHAIQHPPGTHPQLVQPLAPDTPCAGPCDTPGAALLPLPTGGAPLLVAGGARGAGDSVLFWAIDGGPALIRLLLDYGADADAVTPRGWTALSYAKVGVEQRVYVC